MDTKVARHYIREIDKRIRSASDALGDGQASSFEDYRRRAGEISALKQARALFLDTLKAFYDGEIVEEVTDVDD